MDWFNEIGKIADVAFSHVVSGIVDEVQKTVKSETHKLIRNTVVSIKDTTGLGHTNKTSKTIKSKPRSHVLKKRRAIPLNIRHDVLVNANYTCQYCGAKAPKVKLEVDHIVPVSKGGTNHVTNLQCLCFDCNRGKSNKLKSTHSI